MSTSIPTKTLAFRARSAAEPEPRSPAATERQLLREYQSLALSLEELFTQVFFAYNRFLTAYLRRRRWDEATIEDLLQSAWIVLWNDLRMGTFFQRGERQAGGVEKPMLAFLVKTCENLARNIQRHNTHFPRISLDEIEPDQMTTLAEIEAAQADARMDYRFIMQMACAACAEDELRVLDLLALGFNRIEIAEIMGQKPHWVDNRRRAACQKIRAEIARR
ncbi:MAG: sigma-70 family RNA polymerase sigma factor [Blastocatellia bacterium]